MRDMVTICSTVCLYCKAAFIPPHPPSQPTERQHSNDITPLNIKCLNRTSAWEQSYNAYLRIINPSIPYPLLKTTVFLNLGLVESSLDRHHFWKDRRDWYTRRRDDIRTDVAVIIPLPLREEERRHCSTKAWTKILTRKFWDAKEEEADTAVDHMYSIHYFTPSLTVSWSQSKLSVIIVVVVLLLLVLVSGKYRPRVS